MEETIGHTALFSTECAFPGVEGEGERESGTMPCLSEQLLLFRLMEPLWGRVAGRTYQVFVPYGQELFIGNDVGDGGSGGRGVAHVEGEVAVDDELDQEPDILDVRFILGSFQAPLCFEFHTSSPILATQNFLYSATRYSTLEATVAVFDFLKPRSPRYLKDKPQF
ncbi:hypothetical protein B0H19DRAFT_1064116 [Mycena capillaripes]|nr:hypothetical protein B0H19DRAFT_1064116 [Mycena capillaripes]